MNSEWPALLRAGWMPGHDSGANSSSDVEFCFDLHLYGAYGIDEVVEYLIGDSFVKVPFFSERPEVKLERLQFNDVGTGLIVNREGRKVGLTSSRAKTGKFRANESYFVLPVGVGIGNGLECAIWLDCHDNRLSDQTGVDLWNC